jgi:hypothetical protein
MRIKLLAGAVVATSVLAATGLAAATGAESPPAPTAGCIGLTCAKGANAVPQADAPVPSLSGPQQLLRQTKAGFYEFGAGTTTGRRAVAYVVPYGQAGRMPASVRDLPVVDATEEPAGVSDFDLGTVVIFGPDVSLVVSQGEPAASTPVGRRGVAHTSAADQYGCDDNYFCLYSCGFFDRGPGCAKVQFGSVFTGRGWQRLGDYGFNDRTQGMRNRRGYDSLLARDWPAGSSTRYCADSHSADATLSNNALGERHASSFANVPDDIHC